MGAEARRSPKGLIDNLTVDGKIYSVPANIHRRTCCGATRPCSPAPASPRTRPPWRAFFADLDKLKAKNATPLAIGAGLDPADAVRVRADQRPGRGQVQPASWNGKTDWAGADVTKAIGDFKKLLTYTNTRPRHVRLDRRAEKMVQDGKAGYQLMGDWEAADLDAKGFKDYGYSCPGNAPAPSSGSADSFDPAPRVDRTRTGTKCWLKTVGSAAGQKAFNTKKGSIPARTDATASDYRPTSRRPSPTGRAWTRLPSCAHGSACSQGFQGAASSAMGEFSDGDAAALQTAFVSAAKQFAAKK